MGASRKPKGGPTVGIDVGSSLIKVAEARPGKEGIVVTALGIAPTPPGVIDNEIIVDPQTLGQAVKRLLSESGISCKRSVSSVAGQSSVVVRIIEVPRMTRQELAETMKWEVERHVPFAASEVVMDFQPVERPTTDPSDQNMEVLLAVAQQEMVNAHVEMLFAAGMQPAAIDVEPLAASRSLIDAAGNGARDQTIAIINIGASSTDLGVYQNGLIAFPRTLPIAGDTITRSISDNLRIPLDEAERIKRERAVILLDRAADFGPAVGIGGAEPAGDFGAPDATVGLAAPPAQESQDGLGFMPGLAGLGPSAEQEASAPSPATPDFDIDVAAPSAPPPERPVMDFDLSDDSFAAAPAPQIDLSADIGGQEPEVEAPQRFDLAGLDQSTALAPAELSEEHIFDAMAPVLGDLIAEIRRSLEYYASRFQSQPDRILLCGGTAKLPNLDRLLQNELGLPVAIANPLENVTVLSRSLSPGYLEEVASVFPVCLGLAIRDMLGE